MSLIFVPAIKDPDDTILSFDNQSNIGQIDWGGAKKTYEECKSNYDEIIEGMPGRTYAILQFDITAFEV